MSQTNRIFFNIIWWLAETAKSRFFSDDTGMDRILDIDFEYLGEGLVNENDGYEDSKTFFGEACDIADQEAEVKSHHDE